MEKKVLFLVMMAAVGVAGAETPTAAPTTAAAGKVEAKKDKPEFDIKCTEKSYCEAIDVLKVALTELRTNRDKVKDLVEKAKKAGKDVGDDKLPPMPSTKFELPEEKSASAIRLRAANMLKEHKQYYEKLDGKNGPRYLKHAGEVESMIKSIIEKTDECCVELMRRTSAKRSEGANEIAIKEKSTSHESLSSPGATSATTPL